MTSRDPHALREQFEVKDTEVEDVDEGLVDKLRGGDFKDMYKTAESAQKTQQAMQDRMHASGLCLKADGSVSRGDPTTAFKGTGTASQAYHAQKAAEIAEEAPKESEEDEMKRMRRERMAELQNEQIFRQQGHGTLRELSSEKDFIETIMPHDRAVVLLDDGGHGAELEVQRALAKLATVHIETQFCRLTREKAMFLTQLVQLEGLPTVFVFSHGQMSRTLPPATLFQYCSASAPTFKANLAKLLHRSGAVAIAEGDSCSEDEDSEDERRKKSSWRRA